MALNKKFKKILFPAALTWALYPRLIDPEIVPKLQPPAPISAPASVKEVKLKPVEPKIDNAFLKRNGKFTNDFAYKLQNHPEDLPNHIAEYKGELRDEYLKHLFLQNAKRLDVKTIDLIHTTDDAYALHDTIRSFNPQEYRDFYSQLPDDVAREYVKSLHAIDNTQANHAFPIEYANFRGELFDTYSADEGVLNFRKINALVRKISNAQLEYKTKIAKLAALTNHVVENAGGFTAAGVVRKFRRGIESFKLELRNAHARIKKEDKINPATYTPAVYEKLRKLKVYREEENDDDEPDEESDGRNRP